MKWFIVIAGTIAMIVVMSVTGKPLKTTDTPSGILHLEFAGTTLQVNKVLQAWNHDVPFETSGRKGIGGLRAWNNTEQKESEAIRAAKVNTWLDFLFIFFYTSFFVLCCTTLARKLSHQKFLFIAGKWTAKFAIVAALLDVIENTGMLQSLYGNVSSNIAMITRSASLAKWTLVGLVVLYIVIATVIFFFTKKSTDRLE